MDNKVTHIRKYVKLNHGIALELYQVGTENILATMDKLESRRAAVVGGLIGVLMTVAVVLVGSLVWAWF